MIEPLLIEIAPDRWATSYPLSVSFSRNGYQWTAVSASLEDLRTLRDTIDAYLAENGSEGQETPKEGI